LNGVADDLPQPISQPRDARPGLGRALAAAQAETAVSFRAAGVYLNVAISVVAVTDSTSGLPTFRHAGFRDREMHFSGSLLKVAAMLAAFRAAAERQRLHPDQGRLRPRRRVQWPE